MDISAGDLRAPGLTGRRSAAVELKGILVPSESSFWEHDPLQVEPIWQEFVRLVGGKLVADLVPEERNFENADFVFPEAQVVAELKEIRTDFSASDAFRRSLDSLLRRLIAEDPGWRSALFGGSREYPKWFNIEFARIFRPHVSRLLKKANRQLRETKMHFGIQAPTGVLLMVNDAFTAIGPNQVMALAADALSQAYSSIDCLVYLTVNRYIELVGSDICRGHEAQQIGRHRILARRRDCHRGENIGPCGARHRR